MEYEILFKKTDKTLVATRAMTDSREVFGVQTDYQKVILDLVNLDEPAKYLYDSETNSLVVDVNYGKYLKLTVDIVRDLNENGIADIDGDGISIFTFTIKKYNADDSLATLESDNDELTINTTRGKLSTTKTNLVNGQVIFTLRSVDETTTATVTVKNKDSKIKDDSMTVEFL